MNTKPLIWLVIGLALAGIGFLWQNEASEFLLGAREMLVSRMDYSVPFESDQDLEIVLPEIVTETKLLEVLTEEKSKEKNEEKILTGELVLEEDLGSSDILVITEQENKVTLTEIQAEVDRIEKEADIIALRIGELVRAKEAERIRFAEIQGQIGQISEQIESISHQLTELTGMGV